MNIAIDFGLGSVQVDYAPTKFGGGGGGGG